MFGTIIRRPLPVSVASTTTAVACQTRSRRREAFGAELDQDALEEARQWHQQFDASHLPQGKTTFARSSGPGGQHVNKTETKAITTYPCTDLFALLPKHLHSGIRTSKYYTAGSDSWTFHAQAQRSRTANADENRRKLTDEVMRIYHELTPNETSNEKKKKYEEVEKRFHDMRIKSKKMASAKKQSRRGPAE